MAIVAQVIAPTQELSVATAARLTSSLRDMAYRAEWPTDVIVQLVIKSEDSNLFIYYPEELEEQINNLEYGTPNQAPQSVFRPFIARFASELEQDVSEGIIDTLAFMGVFN